MIVVEFDCNTFFVARRGASLVDERSPSRARADGARRSQTARAWPRAAQHIFRLLKLMNYDNEYSFECICFSARSRRNAVCINAYASILQKLQSQR